MSGNRILRLKIVRFIRDEDKGAIAVEAGFALPGLLLFLLGFMTILTMQNASTSVGKVTYTVADILTQVRSLDARSVDCAFLAGDALMSTSNAANLQLLMVGVEIDSVKKTATVAWSRGHRLEYRPLPAVGTDLVAEIPPELMADTAGFVVLAEGRLTHTDYVSSVLRERIGNDPFEFEYKNFFIPRITNDGISCTDCNTSAATTCTSS